MINFKQKSLIPADERLTIGLIFLATLLIRIPFFLSLKHDPAFLMPIIDSLEFDTWAGEILRGNLLWTQLQNHTPLYAYFLAAFYKILGYSIPLVILFQYLIAAFSNVLLYLIAKKITNKATAIISTIFMATYWFLIYVQSFLYCENLSILLNLLLIYVLINWKNTLKKYLLVGIILGLSVICRPDILIFAVLIYSWLVGFELQRNQIAKFYASFLTGLILILAPVVARNCIISHDLVFLRTQIGANFYMGNNPDFKGTAINLSIGKDWEDFISLPQQALKRGVTESESNRYFINATLKIIKEKPLEWLKLVCAKTFSVLTGRDFLRSEDVYFYDNYMSTSLLSAISTRLIFILAVLGLSISFQNPQRFKLLYIFILSGMFLMLFQIKTRYLMPIVPFLIIFASWALYNLHSSVKNKQWVPVIFTLTTLCFLNLISFFNPLGISAPTYHETYYAIGKNFAERGIIPGAIDYYNRAIKINPRNLSVWNDLGLLYLNTGNYDRALKHFDKALSIDKNARKTQLNYQLCQKLIAQQNERKQ